MVTKEDKEEKHRRQTEERRIDSRTIRDLLSDRDFHKDIFEQQEPILLSFERLTRRFEKLGWEVEPEDIAKIEEALGRGVPVAEHRTRNEDTGDRTVLVIAERELIARVLLAIDKQTHKIVALWERWRDKQLGYGEDRNMVMNRYGSIRDMGKEVMKNLIHNPLSPDEIYLNQSNAELIINLARNSQEPGGLPFDMNLVFRLDGVKSRHPNEYAKHYSSPVDRERERLAELLRRQKRGEGDRENSEAI